MLERVFKPTNPKFSGTLDKQQSVKKAVQMQNGCCSHMTSQLATEKRFFLSKWQFKVSHEHNDLLNLNSIRCKHCHRCYNYSHQMNSKFCFREKFSQNFTTQKNIPFFQNDNLTFLMNTIICSILTLFTS